MNIIGVKMTIRTLLAGTGLVLAASVLAASAAAPIRPALVYAMGGKFDKSFSEGLYRGAEKFKAETKINYVDFEISNETQFEQAYRRFAQHGMDPIIGVSFSQADAVTKVAKDFPHTHFTLIDGDVKLPNVQRWNSTKRKALFWWACWPLWRPRPTRSVLSAAWTFR
jgi:basic membrane protein A and related proteins